MLIQDSPPIDPKLPAFDEAISTYQNALTLPPIENPATKLSEIMQSDQIDPSNLIAFINSRNTAKR